MTKPTSNLQMHNMLMELSIPIHFSGYRRLLICIPQFAKDPEQRLTKELYPYVAKQIGCNPSVVETTIRRAIHAGWEQGYSEIWSSYFPNHTEPPSNLVFIATLAKKLE